MSKQNEDEAPVGQKWTLGKLHEKPLATKDAKCMKRIPLEEARGMLVDEYEDTYLEADEEHVLLEWRKLIGRASHIVEVNDELFIVVAEDDCSYGLEEYPEDLGHDQVARPATTGDAHDGNA